MRRATVVVTIVVSLVAAGRASAATFYVRPNGDDAAAGTSPSSAWRSMWKVNATRLSPGDKVLFRGGARFAGLLKPQGSGASGSPIAFGSYGGGRANIAGGIELQSQRWLMFDGLRVDTGSWQTAGSTRGIRTADSGSGVQNVVVTDSQFVNVAIGMLFSNHRDRNWTISKNLVSRTGDSGILIFDPHALREVGATDLTFTGNTIVDTRLHTSLGYRRHAVYDVGTNLVWRNNVIRRFSEDGFSLRARGNTLIGNTISDGPYAIYYSPYDAIAGKTTIAQNRISRVTADAVEVASFGKVANVESFLIADNTIRSSGSAHGVLVHGTAGSVAIVRNVVETQRGTLFQVDRLPGRGLVERDNLWQSGTPSWRYLGNTFSTLSAYLAASGQGTADRMR